MIVDALAEARTVVSVGSGTGSYEPADRTVIAVEPSVVMIDQRRRTAAPAVRGIAESLPVRSASFDAALAVLTIHHWSDPWAGLAELRRVARRQVVLTFDPVMHCTHWLVEYVPEIADIFHAVPAIDAVAEAIEATHIRTALLAHDTPDGMTIAYWRRPEAYLKPDFRAGGSALQRVDPAALERGLRRLQADLASGAWHARHNDLLTVEAMDYGLRLVHN
jgi:SAM-dependent methyltransferase